MTESLTKPTGGVPATIEKARKVLYDGAPDAAMRIKEIATATTAPRNAQTILDAAKTLLDRTGIVSAPAKAQTNVQINIGVELIRGLQRAGFTIPPDRDLNAQGEIIDVGVF